MLSAISVSSRYSQVGAVMCARVCVCVHACLCVCVCFNCSDRKCFEIRWIWAQRADWQSRCSSLYGASENRVVVILHVPRGFVCLRCELFSTKGTSHWHTPGVPLLSLRVCARLSGSVHRVGNCTVDGWWCVLTRRYAFGLLPLLCTSQIGDCQSANCFTLQMARSGGLNHDTVRKQRRSLLSPWAWSLAQGHRSTRSPVSFFSFMVAMKKQNNDEWNKRVFQSWKAAQMDWLRV